jgi:curved DNA-binding protein CbpA
VMVCDGLLTADELERAQTAVARTQQPFGVILEKLGLIERKRLEDVLALYIREALLAVFGWEGGSIRFEERVAEGGDGEVMPSLSTGEIILDAVRLMASESAIRHMLGDLNRIPVSSPDPLLRFQRIPLTPTDGYVLSRVGGAMTARQIIELAPAAAVDVERCLLGLFCTGMIEFIAAPAEKPTPESAALRQKVLDAFARLHTRNHFEVLGVPPTASASELRAAYVQQARLFHPDSQHDPALADLRDHLEKVFARVNEAYEALSQPARRADYERFVTHQHVPPAPGAPPRSAAVAKSETPPVPPSPVEAARVPAVSPPSPEQVLSDATHLFGEGRYWEMIGLAQGVMAQAQGETRRRLQLLRGQAYLRQPDYRKQAIQEFEAVLAEDPTDAQAHYFLGLAYSEEGLAKRALRHLRRALDLRPQYKEAQREIARLEGALEE